MAEGKLVRQPPEDTKQEHPNLHEQYRTEDLSLTGMPLPVLTILVQLSNQRITRRALPQVSWVLPC